MFCKESYFPCCYWNWRALKWSQNNLKKTQKNINFAIKLKRDVPIKIMASYKEKSDSERFHKKRAMKAAKQGRRYKAYLFHKITAWDQYKNK